MEYQVPKNAAFLMGCGIQPVLPKVPSSTTVEYLPPLFTLKPYFISRTTKPQ